MSRTIRRNQRHVILKEVGTLAEARRKVQWWHRYRFPDLPVEVAYVRHCRHITSDGYDDMHFISPPRWYLDVMFTRPNRRESKREIKRCLTNDCWDDHLDPGYVHGAGYHYW